MSVARNPIVDFGLLNMVWGVRVMGVVIHKWDEVHEGEDMEWDEVHRVDELHEGIEIGVWCSSSGG